MSRVWRAIAFALFSVSALTGCATTLDPAVEREQFAAMDGGRIHLTCSTPMCVLAFDLNFETLAIYAKGGAIGLLIKTIREINYDGPQSYYLLAYASMSVKHYADAAAYARTSLYELSRPNYQGSYQRQYCLSDGCFAVSLPSGADQILRLASQQMANQSTPAASAPVLKEEKGCTVIDRKSGLKIHRRC